MLDYLRFMISKLDAYEEAVPLLQELLEKTQERHITDLCSGAGGGIAGIRQVLSYRMGIPIRVTLTDLYPNHEAYDYLSAISNGAIDYMPKPVDATAVPPTLKGVRTIFSSFHHFPPKEARQILQDAADRGAAIGIFEGASKSWAELLMLWLVFPFVILAVTPFIRPFKLSRILFTYLVPLIPLGIIWDGTVSLLRIYPPGMLRRMVKKVKAPNYTWRTGKAGTQPGKYVIYLIGYPEDKV